MTDDLRNHIDDNAPLEISFDDAPEELCPTMPATDALIVELDAEEATDALIVEIGDEDAAFPGLSAPAADGWDLTKEDIAAAPSYFPGITNSALPTKVGKKTAVAPLASSTVSALALAGLIGGLVGWILTEPLQSQPPASADNLWAHIGEVALYAALVGAAIGAALGAGPGASVGVARKALRGGGFGLLFGALGGALGGAIAEAIYGTVHIQYLIPAWGQILLRGMGWSMLGLFIGIGQAAITVTEKKMRNGILGGAAGGFLGGALFQVILNSVDSPATGRALALCTLGTAIGILISLVEEAAKEAWVRVVGGPLAGKQFILYEEQTRLGSSPVCEITLLKDPEVAPEHAVIQHQRTAFVLSELTPGALILVNGRPVTHHLLDDGDIISIGQAQLEFHERVSQNPAKAHGVGKGGIGYGG